MSFENGTEASQYLNEAGKAFKPASPVVHHSIKNDTSPPLRDLLAPLPSSEKPATGGLLAESPPEGRGASTDNKYATPEAQAQPSSPNTLSPIQSFDGLSQADNDAVTGSTPPNPDVGLAVGPSHIVEMINLTYAVYDKNGNLLIGPASNSSVWSGFGGPCETGIPQSPIVLYDHLAGRWLLSQFAASTTFPALLVGPFYECIAISQTNDPTGAYHRYAFPVGGDPGSCSLSTPCKRNLSPKIGTWTDAYYMTGIQKQYDGAVFQGPARE